MEKISKLLSYCDVLLVEIADIDNRNTAIQAIISQDYFKYREYEHKCK